MTDPNNNTHVDTLELDPSDGQPYIVELRDQLLSLLQTCHTIDEVEQRLMRLYPKSELVRQAICTARRRIETTSRSLKIRHHSSSSSASFTGTLQTITCAVAKVTTLVREGMVGSKGESEVSRFKMAFIECIINDVMNLASDFVRRQKGNFIITRSDIRTAMHADKDLLDMFLSDDKSFLTLETHPILAQVNCTTDTIADHHHHKLSTLTYKQKVRYMVDSENSFIRGLNLIIKVFKAPLMREELSHIKRDVEIIFCNIDELLELSTLLLTIFEEALESVGQEENEIPYIGSEIFDLAQPEEFHAYYNFTYRRLKRRDDDKQEGDFWKDAYLRIITSESTMASIKTACHSFDLAVIHLLPNYLLNTIIQFFEYFKNFNELYELSKKHDNRDDELALKKTLVILRGTKKAIEDLLAKELDQKEIEPLDPNQSADIRSMLERRLDVELKHERNLPLPFMPPPDMYRFSEPDSKDNIQFEEKRRDAPDEIPAIRWATLTKLVERLTYHKYQPTFVDAFLTTYRSFISNPEELLDLLIERFKIPDPPLFVVYPNFYGSPDELPEVDRIEYKQYLKRFRQEYSKPVKMRVINVLKSWIKNHYYDFERYPALLGKLNSFLDEVYNNNKVLRTLIASIKKSIEQKKISQRDDFEFMLSREPPPVVWWTAKANEKEKFDILTLHPIEFARQLTLFEFDLFRAIKPSEWINVGDLGLKTIEKQDKYESTPNLSRMTRHFTLLSYWIRKCIVEAEDFDKRSAIYNRAIEIMGVLRELNNFIGLLSIGSAVESAPINRLHYTKKTLTSTTKTIMDEYKVLNDQQQKKLQMEVARCNPPCIPYLGTYHTKLIHAKEGNKTFIDEVDTTTSPTLSNDEFHSSFSSSPATPISPRTPLPYYSSTSSVPPSSANSMVQNQFFGGSTTTLTRQPLPPPPPLPTLSSSLGGSGGPGLGNNATYNGCLVMTTGNGSNNNMCHSNSPSSLMMMAATPSSMHQQPLTPAPPKMINFTKQRIRARIVAEICRYQNPPYCLKVQPEIRHFIESIESNMTKFVATLEPQGNDNNGSSIENNVDAMTRRLDYYLFEQSGRIEPKNCTKPPRSKSKLPDCWKSPGIKGNSTATK